MSFLYNRNVLNRSFIGFDELFDEIDSVVNNKQFNSWPYDIVRLNDGYCIDVAASGFRQGDLSVSRYAGGLLIIRGIKVDKAEKDYVHKSIDRYFTLEFNVGGQYEIERADFENGLLSVKIRMMKPPDTLYKIPINADAKMPPADATLQLLNEKTINWMKI